MTTDANYSSSGFDQRGQHVDKQTNVGRDYVDNSTHFHGDSKSVNEEIMVFETFMDDKLQNFVGREFVFKTVDEFIKNNDSGYFIIRGEPGVGKSSLMARLIRERNYIHHFNIVTEGIVSPKDFLRNICAQLIIRYDLREEKEDKEERYKVLPHNAGDNSGFLSKLLAQAASEPKNHPIVLAVDSLDESSQTEMPSAANILYLPRSLPKGVFVVATTRWLDNMRLDVSREKLFDLRSEDKNNQEDIDAYIRNFIKQDEMVTRLAALKTNGNDFILEMKEKSEGNFMYLFHVLPAFRDGAFKNDSVENLPQGLVGFYKRHWLEMKEGNDAELKPLIKPIICMLGVVGEPIDVDQIKKFMKIDDRDDVSKYIGLWREFLTEVPVKKYRIYHTSFQDFLKEQVDPAPFNEMISNYYLSLI